MDTLTFAISYPSIVEEATKRICELPYNYFTSERHHYEKPQNFIEFAELPTIPRLPTLPISKDDLQLLLDFKKRYVEPARVGTVRSDTTENKFSILLIALYKQPQPEITEIDLSSFFTSSYKRNNKTSDKEIYPLHSLFSIQTESSVFLAVTKVPITWKDSEISCDIFVANPSSTVPQLGFFEAKDVVFSTFTKHHGEFRKVFGQCMKMKTYWQ